MSPRTTFYVDKGNKKVSGVCAGIADYTGIDATIVRILMLVLVWATGGTAILGYFIAAHVAPEKPRGLYQDKADAKFWQGVRANPSRSTGEVRSKFRELDRRLADIELHYTSRNQRLADEIESLR